MNELTILSYQADLKTELYISCSNLPQNNAQIECSNTVCYPKNLPQPSNIFTRIYEFAISVTFCKSVTEANQIDSSCLLQQDTLCFNIYKPITVQLNDIYALPLTINQSAITQSLMMIRPITSISNHFHFLSHNESAEFTSDL